MKKRYILILVIVLLLLVFGITGKTPPAENRETVFGAFTTTDMTGDPVNEQIFSGHKLTMVNIWATFCSPCINEMPYLKQLQTEFGDELQVVGIIVDATDRNGNVLPEKREEAAYIIEMTGADYLHLLPCESLNSAYLNGVQSVPETIFVDEYGCQVGESYIGARSKTEWQKIINTLLEGL